MMQKAYDMLARVYVFLATIALMLFAILLLVISFWEVANGLQSPDRVNIVLDNVGLMIIGFAIVETAKFVAEEEMLRRRELRAPVESRRSLTKFITILVIASSLEALVMIFKTSRTSIADTIFPAALFAASMVALVSLGVYQWLSSRILSPSDQEKSDDEKARL